MRIRGIIPALASVAAAVLCVGLTGCGNFWQPGNGGSAPSGATLNVYTRSSLYSSSYVYISSTGVPYQQVAGAYYYNTGGSAQPTGGANTFGVDSSGKFSKPDITGSAGYIQENGLNLNTTWKIYWNWTPVGCTSMIDQPTMLPGSMYQNTYQEVASGNQYIDCPYQLGVGTHPNVSPGFVLAGATPSSISETASVALSATYGNPLLQIYDRNNNLVSTMTETSIAGDGVTATFPFPTGPSGSALPADLYSTVLLNINSDGSYSYAGGMGGTLSISSMNSNYPGAFGVAAASTSSDIESCTTIRVFPHGTETDCDDGTSQASFPIVTLSTQNKVSISGTTITVGSQPTAVVAYGTNSITTSRSGPSFSNTTTTVGTGYALVTNSGDATVSIVDVLHKTLLATVAVGNGPVAAVVSADGSTAYVANYTDGTVSSIDLSSYSVTATADVGSSPAAIDLDASGNVWVGTASSLVELDPSNLSQMSSAAQSGSVTSLAISKATGTAVTTQVASSSGSTPSTLDYSAAYATGNFESFGGSGSSSSTPQATASTYATYSAGTYGGNKAQLANGTLVSMNYGNILSVSVTPGGFAVRDIAGNATMFSGSLPTPGRGMAEDPDYGYVYITLPDSGAVVTVPLPNEPNE